jgi:hypothetical protein
MSEGDYITSGVLQDYCLGLLTPEEERKVEVMSHAYPRVACELHLLRQALKKYADSSEIHPRSELRMEVWKAVKKLWEENS